MQTITREQAKKLIYDSQGKTFSAITRKRTNQELRQFICRLGVKKGVKGGVKPYEPSDYDLICVFDFKAKGFRMIAIDSLHALKIDGVDYAVVD